jgi:hypothetical protein
MRVRRPHPFIVQRNFNMCYYAKFQVDFQSVIIFGKHLTSHRYFDALLSKKTCICIDKARLCLYG